MHYLTPALWWYAAHLLLLTALVATPALVFAEGLTLEQVARLQSVTGASVSPDGHHIATYYSERFAAAVMFVGLSNKISALPDGRGSRVAALPN